MGTCCQPGGTDSTDKISLLYIPAAANASGKRLQMTVVGLIDTAMGNNNQISVTAFFTGKNDFSVRGGLDWCSAWCGIVNTQMRADNTEYGVLSPV